MKLQFKEQDFQVQVVKAVVDCFFRQPIKTNRFTLERSKELIRKAKEASIGFQSIEMETGTGKTYTYIRTMYELHKHYGWSKFIVIVSSIAICEGVYKSFQAMEKGSKQKQFTHFYIVPIYIFLLGKNVFFRGLYGNFSYFCSII
ncbi:hypothetical protein FACS189411_03630 [Bacteroidia bacterium]|nr:hypothetical protein FACS189411_03630 [Bacteroidia bacterium]